MADSNVRRGAEIFSDWNKCHWDLKSKMLAEGGVFFQSKEMEIITPDVSRESIFELGTMEPVFSKEYNRKAVLNV